MPSYADEVGMSEVDIKAMIDEICFKLQEKLWPKSFRSDLTKKLLKGALSLLFNPTVLRYFTWLHLSDFTIGDWSVASDPFQPPIYEHSDLQETIRELSVFLTSEKFELGFTSLLTYGRSSFMEDHPAAPQIGRYIVELNRSIVFEYELNTRRIEMKSIDVSEGSVLYPFAVIQNSFVHEIVHSVVRQWGFKGNQGSSPDRLTAPHSSKPESGRWLEHSLFGGEVHLLYSGCWSNRAIKLAIEFFESGNRRTFYSPNPNWVRMLTDPDQVLNMSQEQLRDCCSAPVDTHGYYYFTDSESVDKSTGDASLGDYKMPPSPDHTHPNAHFRGDTHGHPEWIPKLGGRG